MFPGCSSDEEKIDTRKYGRVAKNEYFRHEWTIDTSVRSAQAISEDPCIGVSGRNSHLFAAMCAPPYDERDQTERRYSKKSGDHQDQVLASLVGSNILKQQEKDQLTFAGGKLYAFFSLVAAVGICIGNITPAELAKRKRTFNKAIQDGRPILACRCIRSLQYAIKGPQHMPGGFLIPPDQAEKLPDFAIQITCIYSDNQ